LTQEPQVLLMQAIAQYRETLAGRDHQAIQQELTRFIRWCGRDRATSSLTPLELEEYSATLEGVGGQSNQRLAIIKGFLAYLHRQGWTHINLTPHAKLRRTGRKASTSRQRRPPVTANHLTSDGYRRLEAELATLKADRANVAEEIRLAAATKDFSENAPLDAARERQGQLEARIREMEKVLKDAIILEETSAREDALTRVAIGSRIVLRHAQTGQEVSYRLVESSETDPAAGKLSAASPVGKAVMDHTVGDEVGVVTPRGAVRYVVAKVSS